MPDGQAADDPVTGGGMIGGPAASGQPMAQDLPEAGEHILSPVVQATEEATAGGGLGPAAGLNIDADFKQRAQDMAKPATSALMVVIRKVTMNKFLEALAPCDGTVLKTALPPGAEEQLMKTLHGPDSTAPTWEQSPAPAAAGGSA